VERVATPDAQQLAARLREQLGAVTATTSLPTTSGASAQARQSYLDALGSALREKWRQPARSEVGSGNPRVTVSITIDRNGKVLSTQISQDSSAAAMNRSVAAVLQQLQQVLPPSRYGIDAAQMRVNVVFELD